MSNLLKHVEWLLENKSDKLKVALAKNSIGLSVEQALMVMQEADPSERKLAVQWIFDRFLTKGFRWEDIAGGKTSKVHETLTNFAMNRMRLSNEARNLSSYKRLAQVFSAIKPYLTREELQISGKEAKRREKEVCLEESLIVYRDENLIVSVPQTERASKWWGKGTQWCTAASKDNYFDHYNHHSPLIVITFPQGLKVSADQDELHTYYDSTKNREKFIQQKGATRLQLWVGDDVQFMDEEDNQLSTGFLKENWLQIFPFIEWMILNYPNKENKQYTLYSIANAFVDLSVEELVSMFDSEQKKRIARANPHIINLIREWNQDDKNKIYLELLLENKIKANDLPKHLWTPEIAKKFVLEDTRNITQIPKQIISFEFCTEMMRLLGDRKSTFLTTLINVISTKKLWLKLAAHFPDAYNVYLDYFGSVEQLNHDLKIKPSKESGLRKNEWIEKISNGKTRPEWIPYEERTSELCEHFLTNHLVKLGFVPHHLITEEFCLLALERGAFNMWDVPKKFRTNEFYGLALQTNQYQFSSIPQDEITQELFENVVLNTIQKIGSTNDKVRSYETSSRMYNILSTDLLEKYPLSREILEKIIDISPGCIRIIPFEQQTRDMTINALKYINIDSSVNLKLLSEEDLIEICKFNRDNIELLEEEMPDFIRKHAKEFYWRAEMFRELSDILHKSAQQARIIEPDNLKSKSSEYLS